MKQSEEIGEERAAMDVQMQVHIAGTRSRNCGTSAPWPRIQRRSSWTEGRLDTDWLEPKWLEPKSLHSLMPHSLEGDTPIEDTLTEEDTVDRVAGIYLTQGQTKKRGNSRTKT